MKINKLFIIIIGVILLKICLLLCIKIHNDINMIHNITSYIIIQIIQDLNISENDQLYNDIEKLHIKIDYYLNNNQLEKILNDITIFISQLYMLKYPMNLWAEIIAYGKNYYYKLPHFMHQAGYSFPPLFMQYYFIKYMLGITLNSLLFLNLCFNIFIISMFIYFLVMSILKLKSNIKK